MRLMVYSVHDKAVGAYLQPFFSRSKGEAIRSFTEACNDAKSQFNKYAADYVLFELGSYDDGSSLFACGEPLRVISAIECLFDDPFGTKDAKDAGLEAAQRARVVS
jgi:hypothetical protein